MKNKKIALIIDGYSTGSYLAPKLKERNCPCVHVQSAGSIPAGLLSSFHPEDYIENFIYKGDVNKIIKQLKKYKIDFAIPGSEPGVELADELAFRLDLPSNDIQLSQARRNKHLMTDTVSKAGLATAHQKMSDKLDDILEWVDKLSTWPIVLKPVASAGSDLISFCYSKSDIIDAFHEIISSITLLGEKNQFVLANSYITGIHHAVDSISLNGKHFLSDMWECHFKENRSDKIRIVYDYVKTLPYTVSHRQDLFDYNEKVLTALGITTGASHNEIFQTENGPVFIESGARLIGGLAHPDFFDKTIGRNPVDLLIDSYIEPEKFLEEINKPYEIKNHAFVKFLISDIEGKVTSIKHIEAIKCLPSFYEMQIKVKVDSSLIKTDSLVSAPGVIRLIHKDENILNADAQKVMEFEKDMFSVQ